MIYQTKKQIFYHKTIKLKVYMLYSSVTLNVSSEGIQV